MSLENAQDRLCETQADQQLRWSLAVLAMAPLIPLMVWAATSLAMVASG